MTVLHYALEQLYVDQDFDWVVDVVPAVLAWVPGTSARKRTPPFQFPLDQTTGAATQRFRLNLTWDQASLAKYDPQVLERTKRYQTGRTVQREHITELAACGLALVAISLLMGGARVKAVNRGYAPDLLFDVTPGRLRGVEVAGRTHGGRNALIQVRDGSASKPGKRVQLLARQDIAEVSLSLWAASARASLMEQVKP